VSSVNQQREKMIMQELLEEVQRQELKLIQLEQERERKERRMKIYSRKFS